MSAGGACRSKARPMKHAKLLAFFVAAFAATVVFTAVSLTFIFGALIPYWSVPFAGFSVGFYVMFVSPLISVVFLLIGALAGLAAYRLAQRRFSASQTKGKTSPGP